MYPEKLPSPPKSLNSDDWKSIAKGAGVAVAGAALAALADYIGEVTAVYDFGDWTPVVVAGASILANLLRKWYFGQE